MLDRVPPKRAFASIDREIGARLKLLRELAGLTQSALGSGIGVTFQQIQKYEKGSNRISCAALLKIAEILKRPYQDFLEGLSPSAGNDPSPIIDLVRDAGAARICRVYNSIEDPKAKKLLVEHVESLAKIFPQPSDGTP